MNPKDITIVTAVDAEYMRKLSLTWKTWLKFKPEMQQMAVTIIYDADQLKDTDMAFNQFVTTHPNVYLHGWKMNGHTSQREKMLNSLVFAPPVAVKTKWYLKLDADTFAKNNTPWLHDEWFAPENGKEPVWIASPWGYTKPANVLNIMDDWADKTPQLSKTPRLNIPITPGSGIVVSDRMASWVMFAQTAWTKEISSYCNGAKLPFPSQDTFLYFVAARRKDFYRRIKMRKYGWDHNSRYKGLVEATKGLL